MKDMRTCSLVYPLFNATAYVNFIGFWRWCIAHRVTGFLTFSIVRCFWEQKHDVSETGSVSAQWLSRCLPPFTWGRKQNQFSKRRVSTPKNTWRRKKPKNPVTLCAIAYVCGLFYDAVSVSGRLVGYLMSNELQKVKWKKSWANKDIISTSAWKTEDNATNLSQDSQFPGRDSNQASPEYKIIA
jgi:hypothetical protein